MSYTVTVEKKLEDVAKLGLFFANPTIGKNKAKCLQEEGCEVTDSREFNYYPREHRISWKNAVIKCEDVTKLDENSEEYSLAQKLWIISMKHQKIVAT